MENKMANIQKITFLNKRNKRNFFSGITILNGIACLFIVNRFSPLPNYFSTNKVVTAFFLLAVLIYWYFIRKAEKELKQNDNALVLGLTKYAFVLFIQFCMLIFVFSNYFLGEAYLFLFMPFHAVLYFIEKKYPNAFILNNLSLEKNIMVRD